MKPLTLLLPEDQEDLGISRMWYCGKRVFDLLCKSFGANSLYIYSGNRHTLYSSGILARTPCLPTRNGNSIHIQLSIWCRMNTTKAREPLVTTNILLNVGAQLWDQTSSFQEFIFGRWITSLLERSSKVHYYFFS